METKTIRATGEEVAFLDIKIKEDISKISTTKNLMARFSRRTSTFKRRNPIQNFPGCRHFLETEKGNTLQVKVF